jgi:hypothetical protein
MGLLVLFSGFDHPPSYTLFLSTFRALTAECYCGRWFIFLHVLPSGFKEFAVNYMQTHEFVLGSTDSEDEPTSKS